jgi:hypothetical protein
MKLPSRLLFLTGATCIAAVSFGSQLGSVKVGVHSEVRLLSVQRIPAHALSAAGRGIDGLRFVFLASQMAKSDGSLTLKELRDFTVDGLSYRARIGDESHRNVEPQSFILDPSELLKLDASVGEFLPTGRNAAAIVVDIAGGRLPSRGRVRVTLSVGWNDRGGFRV